MFSGLLFIVIIIFLFIVASFIPIGNENSTVRRLPWITFAIMGVNVLIHYGSLPVTADQQREMIKTATRLVEFLESHREILVDEGARDKLKEVGLISDADVKYIEQDLKQSLEKESYYKAWLNSAEAVKLRQEFIEIFNEFIAAREASLWYKYGLAPNGKWKLHQLVTSAFLHGDFTHLFGNLIFFFAVAFSLEDLWGRSTFLAFYLMGAAASSIPAVIEAGPLPGIGASGAISATMGAFLIRLPKTKIRLLFLHFWWVRFLLGRKPITVMVPGYVYLVAYFIAQVVYWYFVKQTGQISTVGYSVHIGGFVFGALFAFLMKTTKYEENYINPKIEAKISFSASPIVTQSLELLDRGEVVMAEHKLKSYVAKNPGDVNGLMALMQVYQQTSNYDQLNVVYGRLIRHHLANNDKEAALYAYDNLLSSFPDNEINVQIPVRDWLAICEYLREAEMNREAGVEYERLVNTYPDDPLSLRACVQGGEAALVAHDSERAMRLFQKAGSMNAPGVYLSRIEAGIEKCKLRLDNRPRWVKQPPKPRSVPHDA